MAIADRSLEDRIYEAAFAPDLWPEVLNDVAGASGSVSSSILVFTHMESTPRFKSTPRTHDILSAHVNDGEWRECAAAKAALTAPPAGLFSEFLAVRAFVPPDRLLTDTSTQRLLRHGLAEQVSTCISTLTGELSVVTVERTSDGTRHSVEEMARLNELRPHLARAGMMACRLALERARNMATAMEVMGLPAVVLSVRGKVLATNALAEARAELFRPRAHGGLALSTQQADALLAEGLAAIRAGGWGVQSIPIEPTEGRRGAIVHVLPVRGEARDVFTSGEVLIVASELRPGAAPPVPLLLALYDLTPTEARIAATLTRGATLQDAATAQGIRISTARTHLAQVFRKTGTHQQSQLVALLSAAGGPTSRTE